MFACFYKLLTNCTRFCFECGKMLTVLVEVAVSGVGIVLTWAYYAFDTSENKLLEKKD